jgi:hypothetical protein
LGVVGIVLALGMIVIGCQTTIEMVRRGFDLSGDLERLGPVLLQTSCDTLRRSPRRTEPGAHRYAVSKPTRGSSFTTTPA